VTDVTRGSGWAGDRLRHKESVSWAGTGVERMADLGELGGGDGGGSSNDNNDGNDDDDDDEAGRAF
jgi:hypothetical protein